MKHFLYPGEVSYTKEEQGTARQMLLKDAYGLPVMVALYHAAGYFLASEGHAGKISELSSLGRGICAAISSLVLYQHIYVVPMPTTDDMVMYKVQNRVGRWVFLTRQIITLQAIHFLSPYHHMTNTLATIIGGFAIFVTVQYFTLVHWSEQFCESCKVWTKKGAPLREQMAWVHLPGAFLTLADVLCVKNKSDLLVTMPSLTTTVCSVVGYALGYIGWIHYNHNLTGEWPYGVLNPLGKSVKKWASFVGFQSSVLLAFVGIARLASFYGSTQGTMCVALLVLQVAGARPETRLDWPSSPARENVVIAGILTFLLSAFVLVALGWACWRKVKQDGSPFTDTKVFRGENDYAGFEEGVKDELAKRALEEAKKDPKKTAETIRKYA